MFRVTFRSRRESQRPTFVDTRAQFFSSTPKQGMCQTLVFSLIFKENQAITIYQPMVDEEEYQQNPFWGPRKPLRQFLGMPAIHFYFYFHFYEQNNCTMM